MLMTVEACYRHECFSIITQNITYSIKLGSIRDINIRLAESFAFVTFVTNIFHIIILSKLEINSMVLIDFKKE
jgi:hypothetical protein